ncbi:MAG TPA: DUF434 domain-containing protein [Syntrophobacter fumaroxidans]|nr:DUF434 domain-containing protein [Syntrophobacter fumaroxidans]
MTDRFPGLHDERQWVLNQAAADFYLLQNRLYPRRAALEWVGNRYRLTVRERELLNRGVFGQAEALARKAKKRCASALGGQCLVVDGHNVQITVESAVLGRPLLKANDGAVRDVAGQSARYRLSEASEVALDMIFQFLGIFRPGRVDFLFDAPMSHSGMLASACRRRLKSLGLDGDARAVPVPEREMTRAECIVAGSDRAVLDACSRWHDLAHEVIDFSCPCNMFVDFSDLILAHSRRS